MARAQTVSQTPQRTAQDLILRLRREPKVARLHEREIGPLWTRHFERLLLRRPLQLPEKAMVLDVLCGTGEAGLVVLRRSGPGVRLVAIDPSSAMLEVAREQAAAQGLNAGSRGQRVFFRSEPAEPRLPFTDDVYDLVLSNLGLWVAPDPRALLGEMVRVARPGGEVRATLPLSGTFTEVYALLEGVLAQRGDQAALERVALLRAQLPSASEARSWLVEAGVAEPRVVTEEFTLLFAGGVDLLLSPVIEYGPLLAWKHLVAPESVAPVFSALRDAVDAHCRPAAPPPPGTAEHLSMDMLSRWPRPFVLTVRAGCLSGRKPAALPAQSGAE